MRRVLHYGVVVFGVCILTVSACGAQTTKKYNGLTQQQVLNALGAPQHRIASAVPGTTHWIYGGVRITFTNGIVSECDFGAGPSVSVPNMSAPLTGSSVLSSGLQGAGVSSTVIAGIKGGSSVLDRGSSTSDGCYTYLGKLSTNRYDPDSISNPYGKYGSRYGNNLVNPYSDYGSRYSPRSWNNPYATDAPRIYAQDGTYLGKLSTNRYDPESISNPYGPYGSRYGNNLVNPYSPYGSRYSPQSWTNPYASSPPVVLGSSPYSPGCKLWGGSNLPDLSGILRR